MGIRRPIGWVAAALWTLLVTGCTAGPATSISTSPAVNAPTISDRTTSSAPSPRSTPSHLGPTTRPRLTAATTPLTTATTRASPTTHRSATPTRPAATTAPAFVSTVTSIDRRLAARLQYTWHDGCPVPLSALSYLRMTYVGFDGHAHLGEMVVATAVAPQVISVFRRLYDARWPIRRMTLVDDFHGSDDASMAADNTSGFNCRPSTGGSQFSQHSYGQAIDLDPRENPYVGNGEILPPAGAAFTDRPPAPGVIHDGDVATDAFAAIGWSWGGDWTSPQDFQHFSANGR